MLGTDRQYLVLQPSPDMAVPHRLNMMVCRVTMR